MAPPYNELPKLKPRNFWLKPNTHIRSAHEQFLRISSTFRAVPGRLSGSLPLGSPRGPLQRFLQAAAGWALRGRACDRHTPLRLPTTLRRKSKALIGPWRFLNHIAHHSLPPQGCLILPDCFSFRYAVTCSFTSSGSLLKDHHLTKLYPDHPTLHRFLSLFSAFFSS